MCPTGAVWTPGRLPNGSAQIATMRDGTPVGAGLGRGREPAGVRGHQEAEGRLARPYRQLEDQPAKTCAAAGIEVICYNFMPVLDWTRTDLRWQLPNGATCMRFDLNRFRRLRHPHPRAPRRGRGLSPAVVERGRAPLCRMDEARRAQLARNVTMGLPGAAESITLDDVRRHLAEYGQISRRAAAQHFVDFLAEVVPVAAGLGLRLCCHPDDPPFRCWACRA
jgi:mannonate dehydratase